MVKIIGFAGKYYTLWHLEKENQYKMDSYGNYHCIGVNYKYLYIKNVSKDLDKVKNLYPGVEIDDELKGKTRSYSNMVVQDLPNNYFWAGKYSGRLIDEIIESDFKYCLWSSNNFFGPQSEYIKSHAKYIEHFENLEKEKQDKLNSIDLIKSGDVIELEFTSNGYNADEFYTKCDAYALYNGNDVVVLCNGVKPVNGLYPYLMPIINGKAQRIKNKKIKVEVVDIISNEIHGDSVVQYIKIK
jgi:hypothetical protein